MKIKLLAFVAFVFLFLSCGNKFDSHDDPPKGATITIANPLTVTTKLNSNAYVNVIATVIVSAYDASSQASTQYSTKVQQITADQWGTPGHININNVNVPKNGPLMIQVMLEAVECNAYAQNCNPTKGGKQRFSESKSVSTTGSAPTSYAFYNLNFMASICCN